MLRSDTPRIGVELVEQILKESGIAEISPSLAVRTSQPPIALVGGHPWVPLAQQIAELEKTAITQALTVTQGNKSAAAQRLGISRAKLYERLTSLNLV
jgi:DNA-binding NtrC family response regulator